MRKFCGFLSLVIMVALLLISFLGSPSATKKMEQDTRAYLLSNGYVASDIVEIKGYYDRKDNKKYFAKVIFAADAEGQCVFAYDLGGNIYQVEAIPTKQ